MRAALPSVWLLKQDAPADTQGWLPRRDLLDATPDARAFVVEVDDDALAHLRFGDDRLGAAPEPGSTLLAAYRVGNGTAGNVGTEMINRLVLCAGRDYGVTRVRNPLPAAGGVDPEPVVDAKLYAPASLRKLERAITTDDWAALAARRIPSLQRAAGDLSWTGSWYEAQVSVDLQGAEEVSAADLEAWTGRLYRYRMMGQDLAVRAARYVSLDVALHVCVKPRFEPAHVKAALSSALGGRGYFHPDKLSFGDRIAASRLVAAALAVPGVLSAEVTRLRRQFEDDHGELAAGALKLGRFEIARLDNDPNRPEIARLDNDPNRPENGRLELKLEGGQ